MMGMGVTTYGDYQLVDTLLTSIITKTDGRHGIDYQISIIDDGTPYQDILHNLENICKKHNVRLILNKENKGVCYSRNRLVQELDTELITIFSNDVTVTDPNWLKCITYFLTNNDNIGIVGFPIEQRIPTGIGIYPENVADVGGAVFSVKKSVYNKVINPDVSIGFWENLSFLEDTHFSFKLIELGFYNYILSYPKMNHATSSTFNKYPELFSRYVDWSNIEKELGGNKAEYISTIQNSRFYSDENKYEKKIIYSLNGTEYVNALQFSRYIFSKYWGTSHDDELSERHDKLALKLFGNYNNPNPVKHLRDDGGKLVEMVSKIEKNDKPLIYGITRCLYGRDFVQQSIKSIDPLMDKIFVFWDDTSWGDIDHCIYKGKRVDFPKKFDDTVDKIKELNNPKVILIKDHVKNNIGQYCHIVNDFILPYYPRPDYILFFEVDMVFRSDQLNKTFEEFIKKDLLVGAVSQVEMWYDLQHRIPDRFRLGACIWNMNKCREVTHSDKMPLTFRLANPPDSPLPPFLNSYNHNLGYSCSAKVMYWKHMLTIASSPLIGDSIPNEDWYEETWLKWDYEKNNRDLEVAKDAGFEIPRANIYDYRQLPEVIIEDFIKKNIFKV